MTEGHPGSPAAAPGGTTLLEDWVTIWQSEMAGLVLDRELQELQLRFIDGWAAQARALLRLAACGFDDGAARPAGPAAAAGTTAPAAAPDARDALIQQLLARVDELERQLAPPPSPA